MSEGEKVTLLLNAQGHVVSVWQAELCAALKAATMNANPWIDGEPDTGAPYRVETWRVQA